MPSAAGDEREDFGFGIALLNVSGGSGTDLVVAAAEADASNAVRVVEDIASSTELRTLPGLASAISLVPSSVIVLGREAGD